MPADRTGHARPASFRHSDDSGLAFELPGFGASQALLAREVPHKRRVREVYEQLLEVLGRPRIDPDRRDLFRFPRLGALLDEQLDAGLRSPVPEDTRRAEYIEELVDLRDLGIVEIVPVLFVDGRELRCNEYIVFQARSEERPLPLKGYLDTAVRESVREGGGWLDAQYRIDRDRVRAQLESSSPRYILYLPYYPGLCMKRSCTACPFCE